jgi:hypothetical protein
MEQEVFISSISLTLFAFQLILLFFSPPFFFPSGIDRTILGSRP